MKSTLFLTIAIASVASVFAAALPGATDMSSTPVSNGVKQVTTASDVTPVKATVQDAVKQDNKQATTQVTSPVVKQETDTWDDLFIDEVYTPFAISSPTKGSNYIAGDV